MKVIIGSGIWKNRPVPCPAAEKNQANFTAARYKTAFFQILENLVDKSETVFCDLFAGSGQMGIEALSRGYKYAIFFEISSRRAQGFRNWLAQTQVENYIIETGDTIRLMKNSEKFMTFLEKPVNRTEETTYVLFADPPYTFFTDKNSEFIFVLKNLLTKLSGARIILAIQFPEQVMKEIENFFHEYQPRIEKYGSNGLCIIQMTAKG